MEGLPADLTALINRLKSLAPGARPSSVDALQKLEWIINKPRRRRRRTAVITAGIALTLMCAALGWQWIRAERNARAAEEETRNANFGLAQALLEKARGSAEQGNWPEVLLFSAGSVLHQARAGRTLPMDVAQPGPFERWRIDTLMTTEARIQDADFDLSRGRCVIASGDNALLLVELSVRGTIEEAISRAMIFMAIRFRCLAASSTE